MRNEQRERLIELIGSKVCGEYSPNCDEWEPHSCENCYTGACRIGELADFLLQNNVVVLPCIAMVEQFIKNGEFDRKITTHNGKIAVVYIDKAKWACPLIDITERAYNTNKAYERIEKLKALERRGTE